MSQLRVLAKESSRDKLACLEILLRGERVGVGGGSASHLQWMPCVGEIELERSPPTPAPFFSRDKERGNSFVIE